MPQADREPNFFFACCSDPLSNNNKIYAKHHENIFGFSRQGELYNGQKWN